MMELGMSRWWHPLMWSYKRWSSYTRILKPRTDHGTPHMAVRFIEMRLIVWERWWIDGIGIWRYVDWSCDWVVGPHLLRWRSTVLVMVVIVVGQGILAMMLLMYWRGGRAMTVVYGTGRGLVRSSLMMAIGGVTGRRSWVVHMSLVLI
jgi:hypothetical protein